MKLPFDAFSDSLLLKQSRQTPKPHFSQTQWMLNIVVAQTSHISRTPATGRFQATAPTDNQRVRMNEVRLYANPERMVKCKSVHYISRSYLQQYNSQ